MIQLEDNSTLEEAAAYLRIAPTVLATMARTKKIGSLKIGKRLVFPRDVIEAYVAANTTPALRPNAFGLTDASARRLGALRSG